MNLANKLMQRLNGQKPLEVVAEQYLKSQQSSHKIRNTLLIAAPIAAITGGAVYLRRNRKQLPETLLKTGRQQIQSARNALQDMNPNGIMYRAFGPISSDLDKWLGQGEQMFNQRIQQCQQQRASETDLQHFRSPATQAAGATTL